MSWLLAIMVVILLVLSAFVLPKNLFKKKLSKKEQKIISSLFVLGLVALALYVEPSQTNDPGGEGSQSQTSSSSQEDKAPGQAENPFPKESQANPSAQHSDEEVQALREEIHHSIPQVPEGQTFLVVNNNVPLFTSSELELTTAYANYGDLDFLQRVTGAEGLLGVELMPDDAREPLTSVTPTGWRQRSYVNVPGGWLYNRCHLIGYQLTGENANSKNLMTGTRWFNNEGMLPIENYVAAYLEETNHHVRYRVTPVFNQFNQLASGVYMEGYSIEDQGQVHFHIFVPNRQPGITIDYLTGESQGPAGPQASGDLSP
ncbi:MULTISPECIES: DNA/RNA non-specific endonuclease [Aerococcus]|uniref:DNA/RNA non-specific endonuclease n=1 Tax=Aerococcus TaxID=1375 RepID=UPI000DCF25D2|nr:MULTISPECIES: DNA/RNA non-specific endonuclease [Aerococcus]KAA9232096.1 DNA-entry nuclease [Aerococcus mictus]MDK6375462.1 DNA/RNA non-specific endonuclease [Aerococcus urinae]MDK6420921.1 DNA/RNA non-specific endonuclease [Aerococcus urinae]MDK8075803.1 DNA/RNA non-specific endonuclease [Aerococcus urinae]MDK8084428.1 DNA/RNA non-specific endonuclease [Aerococcus urinae]